MRNYILFIPGSERVKAACNYFLRLCNWLNSKCWWASAVSQTDVTSIWNLTETRSDSPTRGSRFSELLGKKEKEETKKQVPKSLDDFMANISTKPPAGGGTTNKKGMAETYILTLLSPWVTKQEFLLTLIKHFQTVRWWEWMGNINRRYFFI